MAVSRRSAVGGWCAIAVNSSDNVVTASSATASFTRRWRRYAYCAAANGAAARSIDAYSGHAGTRRHDHFQYHGPLTPLTCRMTSVVSTAVASTTSKSFTLIVAVSRDAGDAVDATSACAAASAGPADEMGGCSTCDTITTRSDSSD